MVEGARRRTTRTETGGYNAAPQLPRCRAARQRAASALWPVLLRGQGAHAAGPGPPPPGRPSRPAGRSGCRFPTGGPGYPGLRVTDSPAAAVTRPGARARRGPRLLALVPWSGQQTGARASRGPSGIQAHRRGLGSHRELFVEGSSDFVAAGRLVITESLTVCQ